MKRLTFLIVLFVCASFSLLAQREVYVKSDDAIQGYDPVAYFKEDRPVKGKDDLVFVWKDATWKFANEENLKSFKESPEKFAPQFGGYCAYGMMRGYKAPTSPDAWTIVDGKLYLNYDKDVRSLWNEKQREYISTANQNWSKVKLEKD